MPNHVGHDNVGHFDGGGEWGVLGFFNKPLMCFVMHWLYFTVKTHSVPSPASALLPKLPFLQLPFVMLSTPLRRYHLFILWNNNPVKTKQHHPPHTHHPPTDWQSDGWTDGRTDSCADGWMFDGWTNSLLAWIIGEEWMGELGKGSMGTGKKLKIQSVVFGKFFRGSWWMRGKNGVGREVVPS